jgi:hypothetical protein
MLPSEIGPAILNQVRITTLLIEAQERASDVRMAAHDQRIKIATLDELHSERRDAQTRRAILHQLKMTAALFTEKYNDEGRQWKELARFAYALVLLKRAELRLPESAE